MSLSLDPTKSALLVMAFQIPIVKMVPDGEEPLLSRTEAVLKKARAAGMQVIYVVVGFRPGGAAVGSQGRQPLDNGCDEAVAPEGR